MKKLLLLMALSAISALNSCVYSETMDQRNAEGQRLQKELSYQTEKGRRLKK